MWSASLSRPFYLESFRSMDELRKALACGEGETVYRELLDALPVLSMRTTFFLDTVTLLSVGVDGDGRGDQAPLCAGGRVPDGFPPFSSRPQGL